MATMNISVPDPMKDWVQSQVETGTYANTSDYVRDLIRKDQENRTKVIALQKAITEGLESGISDKWGTTTIPSFLGHKDLTLMCP